MKKFVFVILLLLYSLMARSSPYEVEFYCNVNGIWRLITDGVDLTGIESVDFSFKHYYDIAMGAFCNNNPGMFTYVKYMMNWPAPGDPYYTQEGNARKTYIRGRFAEWRVFR